MVLLSAMKLETEAWSRVSLVWNYLLRYFDTICIIYDNNMYIYIYTSMYIDIYIYLCILYTYDVHTYVRMYILVY